MVMPFARASRATRRPKSTSCLKASSFEKPSGTRRAPPLPKTTTSVPSFDKRVRAFRTWAICRSGSVSGPVTFSVDGMNRFAAGVAMPTCLIRAAAASKSASLSEAISVADNST